MNIKKSLKVWGAISLLELTLCLFSGCVSYNSERINDSSDQAAGQNFCDSFYFYIDNNRVPQALAMCKDLKTKIAIQELFIQIDSLFGKNKNRVLLGIETHVTVNNQKVIGTYSALYECNYDSTITRERLELLNSDGKMELEGLHVAYP